MTINTWLKASIRCAFNLQEVECLIWDGTLFCDLLCERLARSKPREQRGICDPEGEMVGLSKF